MAEQLWVLPTFGAIESRPVFIDGKAIVASYDGNIYGVYQTTGNIAWKTVTEEKVGELELGDSFIVAASNKKIFVIDRYGNVFKRMNESYIYGIAAGEYMYVANETSVKQMTYDGAVKWSLPYKGRTMTDILLLNHSIIFGYGDELVVVGLDGIEKQRIRVADFWKSRPAAYFSTVFIGANDGKMYAVDTISGKIKWSFDTNGWIMSNPAYSKGAVYFGSNDGNVYAVDADNGTLLWKRKTSEAVQGNIELALVGGKEVLIAGSNDNKVYIIETKAGNVLLTYSARGWVRNPAFNSDALYFGSYDGSFYAYSIDRGCAIDSPSSGESIAYKMVNVSGRAFSKNADLKVFVRVNNGTWYPASLFGNDWSYILDPNSYEFGNVVVECKTADSDGEETGNYAYSVLFRDENAQKFRMKVVLPSSITEKKDFSVKVYDENNGPMQNFTVVVGGKAYYGKNGSATIRLADPKAYALTVKSLGYEDEARQITIGYDIGVIMSLVIILVLIAGVAFYLFVYKKK